MYWHPERDNPTRPPGRGGRGWALGILFTGLTLVAISGCTQTSGAPGGGGTPTPPIDPTPEPTQLALILDGVGAVTAAPGGATCTQACTLSFEEGITVTLTAVPDEPMATVTWSGCDTTTATTCTVAMTTDRTVSVAFGTVLAPPPVGVPLDVVLLGDGEGSVLSTPEGVDCGDDCTATFPGGTSVTLEATAAEGSYLEGWEGCNVVRGARCTVALDMARTVTATFLVGNPNEAELRVTRSGAGAGTVTSSPAGITCGGTCDAVFERTTTVVLSADPSEGDQVASWEGCDTVNGGTCTIDMTQGRDVEVRFEPIPVEVALELDATSCTATSAGESCTAPTTLTGSSATWGGLAFEVSSGTLTLLDATLADGFEDCLVRAAAPRVALVCADPVRLDQEPVVLTFEREASGEVALDLTNVSLLRYDGGASPLGAVRATIVEAGE